MEVYCPNRVKIPHQIIVMLQNLKIAKDFKKMGLINKEVKNENFRSTTVS